MKGIHSTEHRQESSRVPETRYSYYRRCQVFRKGGEQCKAPAEKGSHICYAHAGQLATAVRRERERRAVLAEAVAEMRRKGKPECEMADLFTDFKGINVTLAVMAQALIAGRIDCKTAGRLVVHLQTTSKLLWLYHRGTQRGKDLTTKDTKGRKGLPLIHTDNTDLKRAAKEPSLTTDPRRHGEQQGTPQICADERRLNREHELPVLPASQADITFAIRGGMYNEEPRVAIDRKIREFPEEWRSMQHGMWEEARAA